MLCSWPLCSQGRPRVSSNHKSGWPISTARSTTDQVERTISRFGGPQQPACFVVGPLALKRGRGEGAAARLEQSQIWMADFDCVINYRSRLACFAKICGPAAACVLCSWPCCSQARPRRARRRESRPITNLDGRFRLRDQLPTRLSELYQNFEDPSSLPLPTRLSELYQDLEDRSSLRAL